MNTTRNPLGLDVGEKVYVVRTTTVEYNAVGEKQLNTHPSGCRMSVVGCVRKALGTYVKGYLGGFGADYEQASLKVSKYIRLYECKEDMFSETVLVLPDDIEVLL